jgi:putative DNA primase/helicase
MYEFIPNELKMLKNWVCWQAAPDPKAHSGISKKPINPQTGGFAMSNNPDTWSDFATAVEVSSDFAGIGFMFSGSGYFGVDIDDADESLSEYLNGNRNNIIGEFIDTLQSYAELSNSKKGIHIICKGKLPDGGRRKGNVEMYDSGRFFVIKGNYC